MSKGLGGAIKIGGGNDPFDKRDEDENDHADEYGNVGKRNAIDLIVTSKNGITFSNDQVIGYDLVSMLHGGVFFVSSSTFFACFNIGQAFLVFGMTIFVMCCCIAMVEIEIFTLGDGSMIAVQSSVDYFGGLTGLLFVYFVFNSISGYNACKGAFGSFQGNLVQLIILTTCWIPGKEGNDMEFKEKILRWGIATFALTAWVAGGEITPAEAVGRAVEQDFLTGEEAEIMKASDFHVCNPLLWMIPEYEKMIQNDMKMNTVEHLVLGMRAGIGGTLTMVSSYGQTPLPVTHLMSFLVKMQLMMQAFKSGVDLSVLIFSDTHAVTIQVMFILLSTFVTPIFYQGLLEFVIQISNPFGNDKIDLPTPHIREGLKSYLGMFLYGKTVPMPIINSTEPPRRGQRGQNRRGSSGLMGSFMSRKKTQDSIEEKVVKVEKVDEEEEELLQDKS